VDFNAIKTRAISENEIVLLSGEKGPVSFGSQADFVILFARAEPEYETGNITAFLVPMDILGLTRTSISNMGLLPAASVHLLLEDVRVSEACRVGKTGEGHEINVGFGLCSDFFRILSGLVPLGAAKTALHAAIAHARRRMAFGRPIAQFQAVSGELAEDATLIDMGRWLCYRALWLKDRGLPNAKEAAMCSWFCPRSAREVIENALLLHGHAGYTDEYPLQQMLRDVVAFEMIGGTEETMKLIIAQNVVGKGVIPAGLSHKFV
jgi:cyclohexanecarboxyl-CoA dehydrogenase